MANFVCLHAKDEVERFTRGHVFLHIYALGDLDDFFWPYTTWYALQQQGWVRQLVLLYTGCSLPSLLAYAEPPIHAMRELLHGLLSVFPRRFYAHLSDGVADVLA